MEAAEILRTRAHDMLRRNLMYANFVCLLFLIVILSALGISPDLVKFTVKREMEKEEGGILNSGEKKKEVASQSGVKMEAKEESIDSLPESGYGTLKNEDTVGIKSVRSVILSQEEEDDLLSQSIENVSYRVGYNRWIEMIVVIDGGRRNG